MSLNVPLDFPPVYRGIAVSLDRGVWRFSGLVATTKPLGTLIYQAVIADIDATEPAVPIINKYWQPIMHNAALMNIQSVDGIPWEIHSIEDPTARATALAVFLETKC